MQIVLTELIGATGQRDVPSNWIKAQRLEMEAKVLDHPTPAVLKIARLAPKRDPVLLDSKSKPGP
jgi:hypothetical protein